ncbi:hypothetical protein [Ascidiimonas sp. W6]|uniref:hypothetical protein n=1 Tax=Ascidiimonas meishanensis TaxID=3128903 RepID=UPI0030EF697F
MKNLFRHLFILISLFLILGITYAISLQEISKPVLLNKTKNFSAGEKIILKFSTISDENTFLYCTSSYGSALIYPATKNNITQYLIPSFLSVKSGQLNWYLHHKKEILSGNFYIIPDTINKVILETYLGPQQILAGGKDYAMMTAIPLDQYDNALKDNTPLLFKQQFKDAHKLDSIYTKNMIAWKNIYSTPKTGRILTTVNHKKKSSKERSLEVFPFVATDFSIKASRTHEYADGNQITELTTSIIKDTYGNIVADGTMVNFLATNKKGFLISVPSSTLQGVATGKLLHPEEADTLSIKGYIRDLAESNKITIIYQQAIKDFDVTLSNNGFNITVGPINSFMNQLVPDGFTVYLQCYDTKKILFSDQKTTSRGETNWVLKPEDFPNGISKVVIKVAGIEKSLKPKINP